MLSSLWLISYFAFNQEFILSLVICCTYVRTYVRTWIFSAKYKYRERIYVRMSLLIITRRIIELCCTLLKRSCFQYVLSGIFFLCTKVRTQIRKRMDSVVHLRTAQSTEKSSETSPYSTSHFAHNMSYNISIFTL